MTHDTQHAARIGRALAHQDSSIRLRAALQAGTEPDPGLIGELVSRCRVEPDFYVRDMLTWALTRHRPADTVPMLIAELGSPTGQAPSRSQARSQALHTLSKIADLIACPPSQWACSPTLTTTSRAVPGERRWKSWRRTRRRDDASLDVLATQFGRGEFDLRRSLSRAFVWRKATMAVLTQRCF